MNLTWGGGESNKEKKGRKKEISPLNTSQNSSNIIRRTPSILQDIQTQLSRAIDVGMEHLAYEFDCWWFIGVLFFELHDEAECAVFKGSVCWADDYGVPVNKQERKRSTC